MPHIVVKLYAGRSEQQKKELTEKIVKNIVDVTQCKEAAVSVAIEEFEPHDWTEKVYKPDILDKAETLYRKPGYDPFSQTSEDKEQDKKPSLMDYVRSSAELAAKEDTSGDFNPMSWLDLELEDNPHSFDPFFDTPWHELSDQEKGERMMAIRRVL
ncbi:4-oxalocrotonate tautomerase [Desulfocicer vacuolatum DSM 3385]|uniref:4-oxalocrotonate tautomerase n=1 Tax=Desulfocicer vacuolatum DSM 3385 TaxID=1121400 RepID=A0A1W2ED31_9BACT|nr:tautomerase family protein [Desulfocicer vacuolatum]SMD07619.1 4-oxalocrotonate tautomerase [Desulfocicer vacuolatum DSM 3385]